MNKAMALKGLRALSFFKVSIDEVDKKEGLIKMINKLAVTGRMTIGRMAAESRTTERKRTGPMAGKRIRQLVLGLLTLLAAGIAVNARAQNNPYKIDDRLYPIYRRAEKLNTSPQCLAIADTLLRESIRLGDKKAECIAYVVPLRYYIRQISTEKNFTTPEEKKAAVEKVETAAEKLKQVSRTNGYLQYFYYTYDQLITFYLNNKLSIKALQIGEEAKKQVEKDRHPYGMYTCMKAIANIYLSRSNYRLACEYNKQALDYMLKNLPEQDPAKLYTDIAKYYHNQKEYETALEYCEKGMLSAKTERSHLLPFVRKCIVLYDMQRYADFDRSYRELIKAIGTDRAIYGNQNMIALQVKKYIRDGNYARAHDWADSIKFSVDRHKFHSDVYKASGMYKQCLDEVNRMIEEKDSIATALQTADIAELNAQTDNQRLKMENISLELKQQQTASRYHTILSSGAILFLLLSIAYLTVYLYRRRKTIREIRQKNEELRVARDQAQAANRMKSLFIQNMSHEIRTPLNSIVGFSSLIANPELELEPEDAQEYSQLIQHNSELLTTLVDDLLGLAELESGKYTTRRENVACNDLCREAISTVLHRKPEGVRLYCTSDVPDDYRLRTDGQRVRQVLINFLTNAEKHTTEGEIRLHTSLTEHPGSITFSVTDTGCGIPPEHAEDIFERFEKLNDFEQGTGLGLNICRLIADRLGGTVRLDTTYTHGARFLFVLPITEEEEEEETGIYSSPVLHL